jgi:TRAP-type C4-dicarboxylate transport system permease large subunit
MVASPLAWTVIDYNTTISNLTIWGLITGLIVGFSQAASQRKSNSARFSWSVLVSIAWGGAWFISANVIVDAGSNYAIFGSTGALTATLFLSLFINRLLAKQERS